MSFQDKLIKCADCGTIFTFTAGENKFFASKGLTNEPKRCPQCREARKQQRRGLCGSWTSYASRAMLSREYR